MTKEEAIKLIEHIGIAFVPTDQYGDYDDPEPYEEAIDMAIEALQREEKQRNYMKGKCSCYMPYPNKFHQFKNGNWKCVDKYECIGKTKGGKTLCRKIEK